MTEQKAGSIRDKVNLETSQIAWKDLQRFFASGVVIAVAADLDLVDVACQFASDNKIQVEQWLSAGRIGKMTDQQAKICYEEGAMLWAVVVKPWILVQAVG